MKYGIDQQLAPATADQAQRFLTAMLQRLHHLQRGAARDPRNPVDAAIAVMEEWAHVGAGDGSSGKQLQNAVPSDLCTYPSCRCPFDAPADPDWCARKLPKAASFGLKSCPTCAGAQRVFGARCGGCLGKGYITDATEGNASPQASEPGITREQLRLWHDYMASLMKKAGIERSEVIADLFRAYAAAPQGTPGTEGRKG